MFLCFVLAHFYKNKYNIAQANALQSTDRNVLLFTCDDISYFVYYQFYIVEMTGENSKLIGYWMSEKKMQKLNWIEFSHVCKNHGFELIKVRPLEI